MRRPSSRGAAASCRRARRIDAAARPTSRRRGSSSRGRAGQGRQRRRTPCPRPRCRCREPTRRRRARRCRWDARSPAGLARLRDSRARRCDPVPRVAAPCLSRRCRLRPCSCRSSRRSSASQPQASRPPRRESCGASRRCDLSTRRSATSASDRRGSDGPSSSRRTRTGRSRYTDQPRDRATRVRRRERSRTAIAQDPALLHPAPLRAERRQK